MEEIGNTGLLNKIICEYLTIIWKNFVNLWIMDYHMRLSVIIWLLYTVWRIYEYSTITQRNLWLFDYPVEVPLNYHTKEFVSTWISYWRICKYSTNLCGRMCEYLTILYVRFCDYIAICNNLWVHCIWLL